MAQHNELGRIGEQEAIGYLMDKGYTLIDRNWRAGLLEIDIVAEWHGELVFIEVKTRHDEMQTLATERLTTRKVENLIEAAHTYIHDHFLWGKPYSFDVITVIGTERPFKIDHLQNAYAEREEWHKRQHKRAFEL